MAVQGEIRKERQIWGCNNEHDIVDEIYRRIYGATKTVLLKHFRREKGYLRLKSISLTELKEFTYWLFEYRLKQCDKDRIASDTKKALGHLKRENFCEMPGVGKPSNRDYQPPVNNNF